MTTTLDLTLLSKEELLSAFDLYYENLKSFIYYKTGDIALTEDLVQDVFIKVWEKRNEIDPNSLKGLLFTIANNLVLDHFRHQKVVLEKSDLEKAKLYQWEYSTPEFLLEEQEFKQTLNRVITSMPEGCREAFLLSRKDKLTYNEIASMLDISVKAVEKRISKAMKIVKNQLGLSV